MKETNAQTVIEKLKEAVYFSICYKPKKYNGKPVYRNAKWDDKCKIGNGYIIYYDRDRGGYRCASGERTGTNELSLVSRSGVSYESNSGQGERFKGFKGSKN